jgi:hypothetical protein
VVVVVVGGVPQQLDVIVIEESTSPAGSSALYSTGSVDACTQIVVSIAM